MRKVVDCFLFYNELTLLKYRLALLYPYVDYFVLVEATHTFKGNPKKLYFEENKEIFREYQNKIIHIVVKDVSFTQDTIQHNRGDAWVNEGHQRNCISRGIDQLKLGKEDLLIISDLDEIIDPTTLQKVKENGLPHSIVSLEQDLYYYNLHMKSFNKWTFSKMLTYKSYRISRQNFSNIRTSQAPRLPKGGWHLSYFGDPQFIRNKLQQFSHHEYSGDAYTNIDTIASRMKESTDLFGRSTQKWIRVKIEENDYLPPRYQEFLQDFYTL